jgi:hypothetical protein
VTPACQFSQFVSFRALARELDVDRRAISAIVKRHGLPVVVHPSAPNAKLLGSDEAEAVRRLLTPEPCPEVDGA